MLIDYEISYEENYNNSAYVEVSILNHFSVDGLIYVNPTDEYPSGYPLTLNFLNQLNPESDGSFWSLSICDSASGLELVNESYEDDMIWQLCWEELYVVAGQVLEVNFYY